MITSVASLCVMGVEASKFHSRDYLNLLPVEAFGIDRLEFEVRKYEDEEPLSDSNSQFEHHLQTFPRHDAQASFNSIPIAHIFKQDTFAPSRVRTKKLLNSMGKLCVERLKKNGASYEASKPSCA